MRAVYRNFWLLVVLIETSVTLTKARVADTRAQNLDIASEALKKLIHKRSFVRYEVAENIDALLADNVANIQMPQSVVAAIPEKQMAPGVEYLKSEKIVKIPGLREEMRELELKQKPKHMLPPPDFPFVTITNEPDDPGVPRFTIDPVPFTVIPHREPPQPRVKRR